MSLFHVGKSICTVFSPAGDLYTFWNDYLADLASITFKDKSDTTRFTFTTSETKQYRCLLFQKHYTTHSTLNTTTIKTYPVMFNDSNDLSKTEVYPIYECISPQVYFDTTKTNAILSFWSNMNADYDETTKIYNKDKVIKFEEDGLENVSNADDIKRCMFSAPLFFEKFKIESEWTITALCTQPHLVYMISEKYQVTDFTGGGSGAGGLKVHGHTSMADGGFAFSVYHPGCSLPQKPWR